MRQALCRLIDRSEVAGKLVLDSGSVDTSAFNALGTGITSTVMHYRNGVV